jgi:gas vesicle protein
MFAIGAVVGAGVALLFAPYSGKETRQMLARRSRAVKDGVAGAVKDGVASAVEATKEAVRDQWQNVPTV